MSALLSGLVYEKEIAGTEQRVLLALADHAHDDGSHCFPSIARIAWKLGVATKTVQRTIQALEQRGVLVVDRQTGRVNEYRIRIDALANKEPFSGVPGRPIKPGTFENSGSENQGHFDGKPGTFSNKPGTFSAKTQDIQMSHEPVNRQVEPSSLNRQDARSQKRKRLTLFPEGFGVSPEMRTWAIERGLSDAEVTYESERFEGWAIAKGAQYVDWVRAWQNWMVKSARDAAAGSPGRRAGGPRMSDTAGEDRSQWSEADWFKD